MKKIKAIMSPQERVSNKDYYNMAKKKIMKRGGLIKAQKGKPVKERVVKYPDGSKVTVIDSSGYYWNKGIKNKMAIDNLKAQGYKNATRDSIHKATIENYKRQSLKGTPGFNTMGFPEEGAKKIETKPKTKTAATDSTATKKKKGGAKKYQGGGDTGYYDLAKKHLEKIESNKNWSDAKKSRKSERFLKKIDPAGGGKKTTFDRVIQGVNAAANLVGSVNRGTVVPGPPMMGEYKKGGSLKKSLPKAQGGKWIQKATASIKRRGTEGVCTGAKFGSKSCPPGSKRYNLAKTFKKMAKKK